MRQARDPGVGGGARKRIPVPLPEGREGRERRPAGFSPGVVGGRKARKRFEGSGSRKAESDQGWAGGSASGGIGIPDPGLMVGVGGWAVAYAQVVKVGGQALSDSENQLSDSETLTLTMPPILR